MGEKHSSPWQIATWVLAIVTLILFAVAVQFYFWPWATSVPRPDFGRTYGLNNHGKLLYLTRKEWRVQNICENASLVLIGLTIIAGYLTRDKKLDLPAPTRWWTYRPERMQGTTGEWRPY